MALSMPPSVDPVRLAVLPEHCDAVLRELARSPLPWDDIASLVLRDPALLHGLLAAAPLARQRLGDTLKGIVAAKLTELGADLLRAWLAQQLWGTHPDNGDLRAIVADSQQIAEYAFHLARQSGYPYPDEAYLAGLWCRLAALGLSAPLEGNGSAFAAGGAADRRPSAAAGALAARLAALCEAPAPLVDALALEEALDEQLRTAHPLVRVLWSARRLARDDWRVHVDGLADLTGLDRDALCSLRTDADYLAHQHAPRDAGSAVPPPSRQTAVTTLGHPPRPAPLAISSDPLRVAALAGLIRSGFARGDAAQARARFGLACRLLCRAPPPLVVVAEESGLLRSLALGCAEHLDASYDELGQHLDDEASIIALALRTGEATSRLNGATHPGRSLHDWHVSRWLGHQGLLCLPLHPRTGRAVALIGADSGAEPDSDARTLLVTLTSAAADALIETRRQADLQSRLGAEIEARYRDHARRIAHEARNPLTVIRTYLDLMAKREPQAGARGDELKLLRAELDRLGKLIQQGAEAPGTATEPLRCAVAEVLHDLRALYAETLFASRGIQFELRTATGLPQAAIPASALKQVLLNLFQNAAEALQPGGRFSVAVPGQLLVNGVPCIEIRLVDNGPGLPAERLSDLFTPRPSAKSGDHRGLGLAIVGDILTRWHAYLLCRSQPGTGTGFQLLVPLAESG
jgi:signal transduction histidine kinase